MLVKAQGEVAARIALRLALFVLSGFALGGCQHAPAPLISRRFVRLEALLPLHPVWSQAISIEKAAARLPAAPLPLVPPSIARTVTPSPFVPVSPEPVNPVLTRHASLEQFASRYLAQRAANQRQRNRNILLRMDRTERRRIEEEVEAHRAEREAELTAERRSAWRKLESEIRALGFREVSLQSQVRALTDQPLIDARVQLEKVKSEIATRQTQQQALQENVAQKVIQEMRDYRDALLNDLAARLQERERELEASAQKLDASVTEQLSSEAERLQREAEAIPTIGTVPTAAASVGVMPLTLPPAPNLSAAYGQAQSRVTAALAVQRNEYAARRAVVLAILRDDTRKAVAQIARKQGWKLVNEGTPGATDATEAIMPLLRAQWKSVAAQGKGTQ